MKSKITKPDTVPTSFSLVLKFPNFLASVLLLFLFGSILFDTNTANASCDTSSVLGLCVTATPDPVKPGELITYSYTVTNRGGGDLTGVALSTLIPDHTNLNAITGGGSCSFCGAGVEVRWTLGTIPAGQSRTVELVVRVDSGSFAPADGTIIFNSARVVDSNGNTATDSFSLRVCVAGGTACDVSPPPVTLPTATWTTPPPSSITAGQNFEVAFTTTGSPSHVNIHWSPTDPLASGCC